ncbi:MAG: peptidylprolyl isomerase, partial [Thermoguttaceae bacterium]
MSSPSFHEPRKWLGGFWRAAAAPPRHGSPRAARSRRNPLARSLAIESLEDRRLLTLSLAAIPTVSVPAGTAVCVALNGTDPGQTVSFSATGTNYSLLTPALMPQTNKSVQINAEVNGASRSMTFQLFDNLFPLNGSSPNAALSAIENLFSSGTYTNKTFYQVAQDSSNQPLFVQGGVDPTSSTQQTTFKDQFDPNLQFTGAGVLAMANNGSDSNTTEFFVTNEASRSLDYNHTIFGFQTTGQAVRQQIAAMPVNTANNDRLIAPVTINSTSIFTDTQNGVLMLRAAPGTTGTLSVTVTASDGTSAPVQQTFTVNVVADSGLVTADPWASAVPAAPAVTFGNGHSSLTTTANNSSPQKGISFNLANLTAGDLVTVYANGNPIYSAFPAASVLNFTTDGTKTLADGIYDITVTQTLLNNTVTLGARSEKANVPSLESPPATLTVSTTPPQFTSSAPTAATVNTQYTYQVQASSVATPLSYSLVTSPANMSVSAAGAVTWTPSSSQIGPQAVDLRVTDQAGQTNDQTFTISVNAAAPYVTGGTSGMNSYGAPLSIPISAGPYGGIGSYDGPTAANA